MVLRTGGPSPLNASFHLHAGNDGRRPERFITLERAVAKGETIARARRVRLFYIDSPNAPPYVLRDFTHD